MDCMRMKSVRFNRQFQLMFNEIIRLSCVLQKLDASEAMEEASVMMVGLNPERVMQGLVQLEQQMIGETRNFRPVADYSMPNVSDKVVRIILSYTDYIKRVVWSE